MIVILGGGFTAAGIYVKSDEAVYPNVTLAGIKVGGMTLNEVSAALRDAGYKSGYDNTTVTVAFPADVKLSISGADAGLVVSVDDAAKYAINYGKNGSFFENTMLYLKSMVSPVEILPQNSVSLNEANVRQRIKTAVDDASAKVLKNAYLIKDGKLLITKGGQSLVFDENAIYDMIYKAFQNKNYATLTYTPDSKSTGTVDLDAIFKSVCVAAVDAKYDKTTKGVTQDVTGINFDKAAAQSLLDQAKSGETVSIPLVYTKPKVTSDALKSMLFRDVLSEKSTSLSGSSDNRTNNITLAAASVNGTILNPGDTFSYNDTLGERTAAKGYKEAGAYVSGKTVQEIGGGICQGSSTIYYCVLYANLEVVDRSCHMFTVAYLPLGLDATVNWGSCDFKFKNNTDYPIKMVASVSDGYLNIQLVGTKTTTNYVKMDYVVVETIDFQNVNKEDPTVDPGDTKVDTSGHTGYVVDTYKYIYDANGNLLSKKFETRSIYSKQDRVTLYPVGSLPSPSPSPGSVTPTPKPSSSVPPTPSPKPSATPSPQPSATPAPTPSATTAPSASSSH